MMAQTNGQQPNSNTGESASTKSGKRYRVRMLNRCVKDYAKLVKKDMILQGWVESYIEELQLNPYLGEKLFANFPGCRSIHFRGNSFRIIYRVLEEPEPEILILEIGHRSTSYVNLARILGQGK
jgi:addiction module RelE/StbE family toxin